MGEGVKGEDDVVQGEREVGERWKRHFSDLLTGLGGQGVGDYNEEMLLEEGGSISREEVKVAIEKVKKEKSA